MLGSSSLTFQDKKNNHGDMNLIMTKNMLQVGQ